MIVRYETCCTWHLYLLPPPNRSRACGKKRRCWPAGEVVADGLIQEFKDAALLPAARGHGGPDAFAPLPSAFAACALRHADAFLADKINE